jgi:hypothetical protein
MIKHIFTALGFSKSSKESTQPYSINDNSLFTALFNRNSFESSLPAVSADYLISRNKPLIRELYRVLGLSQSEFDTLIIPVIKNFADYVQILPASEKHHHNGIGGLFRHSLEVFVISARLSTGKSFSGGLEGALKAKTKTRWPVAIGISGLLHDVGKALLDISVVSSHNGERWAPFSETLYQFACRTEYYAVWREGRTHKSHEIIGATIVDQILPLHVRNWINEGDSIVLPVMLHTIAGFESPDMPAVYSLVKTADKESVAKYLTIPDKQDNGEPSLTRPEYREALVDRIASEDKKVVDKELFTPESPTLQIEVLQPSPSVELDSINKTFMSSPSTDEFNKILPELLANKELVVNFRDRERGVFWLSEGQAWASWPQLFNVLTTAFMDRGFTSFPRSPGQFFDMFELAGLLCKTDGQYSVSVTVQPEKGRSVKLNMASISDNGTINKLKQYAEQSVVLTAESLGLNLETNSEMIIPPMTDKAPLVSEEIDAAEGKAPKSIKETPAKPQSDKSKKKNDSSKSISVNNDSVDLGIEKIKEYISSLDNKSLSNLRKTSDGEILEEISAAIITGRLSEVEWGMEGGSIYLLWPSSALKLGEDADDIQNSLNQGKHLVRDSEKTNFSIKNNGGAILSIKGKPTKVLALNSIATRRMIKAFDLNDDFALKHEVVSNSANSIRSIDSKKIESISITDESFTAGEAKNTRSVNKNETNKDLVATTNTMTKRMNKKVSNDGIEVKKKDKQHAVPSYSAKSSGDNKKTVKSSGVIIEDNKIINSTTKIPNIINLVDRYLASNYQEYKARIKLNRTIIEIDGFAEIYMSISKVNNSVEGQLLSKLIESDYILEKKQGTVLFFSKKLPNLKSVINNE